MHKFLLALIFLFLTASTAVLAHSGTDQEQQACTRSFTGRITEREKLVFSQVAKGREHLLENWKPLV